MTTPVAVLTALALVAAVAIATVAGYLYATAPPVDGYDRLALALVAAGGAALSVRLAVILTRGR